MIPQFEDPDSIISILKYYAERNPEAVAILASDESPMTYSELFQAVMGINQFLSSQGLRREDRVALVLPNGIEMVVAFLGILSHSVVAPLNPAYKHAEFDFYLTDTRAVALVADSKADSPAEQVAHEKNMVVHTVLDLTDRGDRVELEHLAGSWESSSWMPDSEDTAIILHTSGTTSRPKSVPLTHANLITSARNIAQSLNLNSGDRCLNVMPLFHVHGMIGALFSTLSVGASIVCPPGFQPLKFFTWVNHFQPTWYTAVPTMHQILLERVEKQSGPLNSTKLRFIRSCSAALPPKLMQELEEKFRVPVIEAYGMTEASHQIACNPLPPGIRKPGSVGLPTGTEIAIMGQDGTLMERGAIGEIVIRGANLTKGYENNPQADSESFLRDWFKTGDQGFIDPESYLIISGRIKEIINRGGEKISPREVDEVILRLDAVSQAVTFPVPHPKLGEDIAAAVVLKRGQHLDDQELRQHVATLLAKFKVPSRVFFVDEIPKGPTGKIQRTTLWESIEH